MYCDFCQREIDRGIELLGAMVCDNCFHDISTTSVSSENYDYYKEMVKKLLKNYIYEKTILDPVK